MPSNLPQTHANYLERVRNAVASDNRLSALLIGGSYIHGGLDEHSDLDFVIVVNDESYADVMATRLAFANALPDLVNAFTGEHVGEPRLLICLYGPPLLHVDLKFVLKSDLDHQIERRAILFAREPAGIEARVQAGTVAWPNHPSEWFETRTWIWLHYAATKLARGELYEAIGMLAFFREQVLGPLLYRRAGKNQRGVRRLEALGLDEHGRLPATIAENNPSSVQRAIEASIDIYMDLRSDDPPSQPTKAMPELLRDFIRNVTCKTRVELHDTRRDNSADVCP
ncbi:nucleotidyltransferase domain-containing protein [Labrys sp. LIt4]|uniref:nucleotidyltransferase domain-containing protein n=1 Tax=Labrys sp. LIt4 TaxID=2821355 RepID=UPI001AE0C05C|nr:nucleotidyltransferase domain-containing protein [Labrys sp. LIt4]MBP0579417.1 nucleotidyltransferase domain-containing protein [Labrys sp. LIt4]